MTSTSAMVNRALRVSVTPVLREAGFTKIDARNGWRWLDKVVWVFNVRSVRGLPWPAARSQRPS
ncbi:MAG: hypothetical protein AB7O52_13165 [Planctomycetota bacterium]